MKGLFMLQKLAITIAFLLVLLSVAVSVSSHFEGNRVGAFAPLIAFFIIVGFIQSFRDIRAFDFDYVAIGIGIAFSCTLFAETSSAPLSLAWALALLALLLTLTKALIVANEKNGMRLCLWRYVLLAPMSIAAAVFLALGGEPALAILTALCGAWLVAFFSFLFKPYLFRKDSGKKFASPR